MRFYTDLEQSKKLSTILPIETADMWWAERHVGYVNSDGKYTIEEIPYYYISFIKPSTNNYSQDTIKDIPCWSLTALLNIIQEPVLTKYKDGSWNCATFDENNHFKDECFSDNPINACYELIINELNNKYKN